MSMDRLIKEGSVRRFNATRDEVERAIEIARRDLSFAEGIPGEDILAGVHKALADKIYSLINRVGLEPDYAISGGGGLNIGLIKSLEEKLGSELMVPAQPRLITAFGAAIIAEDFLK